VPPSQATDGAGIPKSAWVTVLTGTDFSIFKFVLPLASFKLFQVSRLAQQPRIGPGPAGPAAARDIRVKIMMMVMIGNLRTPVRVTVHKQA
jgi:hypothetical protein